MLLGYCTGVLLAFSGELELSYRVVSSESLAKHQTFVSSERFNNVQVQRAPFCCFVKWDANIPLLSLSIHLDAASGLENPKVVVEAWTG